jgi:hypothetical protein
MKPLKIIWQNISALPLSVWLLIISSLILLFNSEVSASYPQLYQSLNTTPLWSWLSQARYSNSVVFIAVVLLIVSLGLLALNTLACTITRVEELGRLVKAKKWGPTKTFVMWAPTVMHILFFLLLAGHMTAFSFGEWQHHIARKGDSLKFSDEFPPLRISGVSRTIREVRGPLYGSTVSHQVELQIAGRDAVISEMKPLKLPNGSWLLLLPPQQKDKKGLVSADQPVDCSGEERHVKSIPFDASEPIKLKQVFDPGIYFLFIGFGLILVLLGFYYTITWRNKSPR